MEHSASCLYTTLYGMAYSVRMVGVSLTIASTNCSWLASSCTDDGRGAETHDLYSTMATWQASRALSSSCSSLALSFMKCIRCDSEEETFDQPSMFDQREEWIKDEATNKILAGNHILHVSTCLVYVYKVCKMLL